MGLSLFLIADQRLLIIFDPTAIAFFDYRVSLGFEQRFLPFKAAGEFRVQLAARFKRAPIGGGVRYAVGARLFGRVRRHPYKDAAGQRAGAERAVPGGKPLADLFDRDQFTALDRSHDFVNLNRRRDDKGVARFQSPSRLESARVVATHDLWQIAGRRQFFAPRFLFRHRNLPFVNSRRKAGFHIANLPAYP